MVRQHFATPHLIGKNYFCLNRRKLMEYNFNEIEKKWQAAWKQTNAYKVLNNADKPKCYVLDMFPYPSGAGLHVGHPLGYIASDIYSRYKRLKGYNVLHPMGFDSFGLPAEQYALETGQHPAVTTAKNIETFKAQLDKIGFCYDWSREVRTSDPAYYRWTQWIFLQLYNSYFCNTQQKARPITDLIEKYEAKGCKHFTADEWKAFSDKEKSDWLMKRRLAFVAYGEVNWCEALGTVLANDEVVNGVSERGGHPVEKKKMRQWYLRITAYADRLLQGLETVEFSEAMKEMQRNWIGKSEGAEMVFELAPKPSSQSQTDLTPNPSSQAQVDLTPNPSPKERGTSTFGYFNSTLDEWRSRINFAKENRKNPTEAEDALWQALRNRKLDVKFRRQHPIAGYIPDFVCLEKRLIVEIDGGYHDIDEQKIHDAVRAQWLAENGFSMLRLTNEEVLNDIDHAVGKISAELTKATTPLSFGEGPGVKSTPLGQAGVRVYTTRPDTIFGVDFLVLAPEHEIVAEITTEEQRNEIEQYLDYVKSRSERERMAEVKQITGAFTGAYALNPFDGRKIPVWISEYVLAGYGTGAIMAVPCGDQRDFNFAKHFNIPITNIIGEHYNGEEANPTKEAVLENSGFLNGMLMKDAIGAAIKKIEEMGIGKRKVNFKMRDAGFSRQRYWGEPFPITWDGEIPEAMNENELPLELPHVDTYGPGPDGEGPLANITEWINLQGGKKRESSTMPGYAGSSWYFLRYMDPGNNTEFCDKTASDYWNQVDVYIGGTEHAVGHLLYSRMWTKFLYDRGWISFDEPFKKLVNQGMIQGSSRFVHRIAGTHQFVSAGKKDEYNTQPLHVDVNIVDGFNLDIEAFKKWKPEYADAEFIFEDGSFSLSCGVGDQPKEFLTTSEVEKMSKSKYNTVNPDDLVVKYGADTFRMYEMFLGPVEQSKPWDTKGIEGVHRFLRKLWRLFNDELKGKIWTNAAPNDNEWKILYKTIKKIDGDTENFSYNTAVSAFMVCVNELTDAKCNKKAILEKLLIILAPFAPHISEELWSQLGNEGSILDADYPAVEEKYLVESTKDYPVSINGKLRTNMVLPVGISQQDVEAQVLSNEIVMKWMEGKPLKKLVFVPNKMINVVV